MTTFPWTIANVLMDDGTEYKIVANQRHQRRAMMPANYGGAGIRDAEGDPLGFIRAVAWAYLTEGDDPALPGVTWPAFDGTCAFVQPVPDDDDDPDGAALVPTRRGPDE
jgi:hypothetical protein